MRPSLGHVQFAHFPLPCWAGGGGNEWRAGLCAVCVGIHTHHVQGHRSWRVLLSDLCQHLTHSSSLRYPCGLCGTWAADRPGLPLPPPLSCHMAGSRPRGLSTPQPSRLSCGGGRDVASRDHLVSSRDVNQWGSWPGGEGKSAGPAQVSVMTMSEKAPAESSSLGEILLRPRDGRAN